MKYTTKSTKKKKNKEAKNVEVAYILARVPEPTISDRMYGITPLDPIFQFHSYWLLWTPNRLIAERFIKENEGQMGYETIYIWTVKDTNLDKMFEDSPYQKEGMRLRLYNGMVQPFALWKTLIKIPDPIRMHNRLIEISEELGMYIQDSMKEMDYETAISDNEKAQFERSGYLEKCLIETIVFQFRIFLGDTVNKDIVDPFDLAALNETHKVQDEQEEDDDWDDEEDMDEDLESEDDEDDD